MKQISEKDRVDQRSFTIHYNIANKAKAIENLYITYIIYSVDSPIFTSKISDIATFTVNSLDPNHPIH